MDCVFEDRRARRDCRRSVISETTTRQYTRIVSDRSQVRCCRRGKRLTSGPKQGNDRRRRSSVPGDSRCQSEAFPGMDEMMDDGWMAG